MAAGPRQKPELRSEMRKGAENTVPNAGSDSVETALDKVLKRRRRAGSRTGLWIPVLSGTDYEGDRKRTGMIDRNKGQAVRLLLEEWARPVQRRLIDTPESRSQDV